jgi:Tfp pilus assembly protein PilX
MRRRLVIGALSLLVLAGVTIVVLLISSDGQKRVPVSAYAFDSRYQVREAESRLDERVLDVETANDRPKDGGEVRLRATRCTIDPPPPAAHRMTCSITTAVKDVGSNLTITRYNERRASIAIEPSTGALKLSITAPKSGREIVTP